MTTPQSPWRSTGNTREAPFAAAVARTWDGRGVSPMAAEAGAIYDALAVHGLTRLGAAMAYHETKNASWPGSAAYGLTPTHKNPWAVKSSGGWRRYVSYADAAADWAARLLDPQGPYAKTTSIAALLHVYAPASDGNDEARYAQVVCAEIDALPLEGTMPPTTNPFPKPPIHELPRDGYRYGIDADEAARLRSFCFPGRNGLAPKGIVLHIQDGITSGSLDWWLYGRDQYGNRVQASSHVLTNKDGSLLRLLPERDGPWTNGDVSNPTARGRRLIEQARGQNVNCVSLTIENEGRPGDALTPGQRNAILWQCWEWMTAYGLTVDDVYRHADLNSVSRSRCPGPYYDEIVAALRAGGQPAPQPPPPPPGPPPRKYPNLPAWVSDDELEKLSMWDEQRAYADPAGPLTNAYIAWCREAGRWPMWIDLRDRPDGKRLHLSDGTILDYENGRVVVRGAAK